MCVLEEVLCFKNIFFISCYDIFVLFIQFATTNARLGRSNVEAVAVAAFHHLELMERKDFLGDHKGRLRVIAVATGLTLGAMCAYDRR